MVEGNPKWRARVVYGDTDSLFVLLAGRSREEAFQIGAEIAAAATAANPPPVTLKMEKASGQCTPAMMLYMCMHRAAILHAFAPESGHMRAQKCIVYLGGPRSLLCNVRTG